MNTNLIEIVGFDKDIEETVFIKVKGTILETFDSYGKTYPLKKGDKYNATLSLNFLNDNPVKIENQEKYSIEKQGKTFGYDLSGKVINEHLVVNGILFTSNDIQLENLSGNFVTTNVSRIIIEFFEKQN